jgi:hypothetical protein
VLIMDACCDLTVSIMMARPLATKPKARNWRPIYYWVPSIAPAEWPL